MYNLKPKPMKKIICIFFAAIVSVSFVSGQIKIGPRVGLNITNVKGDDSGNDKPKAGYNVGIQAQINFTERFGLQPALLFSSKGCIVKSNGITVKGIMNYIEVPLNLFYGIKLGGNELQIIAGPYLAYFAGGKSKYLQLPAGLTLSGLTFKRKTFVSTADQLNTSVAYFRPYDLGLNFGVGFLAMKKIQAQLNFGLGLSNILPEIEGRKFERDYNTNIQISVAYLFGGK